MFDPRKPDLRKLLLHHQKQLLTHLESAEPFLHPTAKGDVGEGAWRELLGQFLPNRYQVSSAFVLDARGDTSEQIDVVVHDRHFCPLLFERDGNRYIPAESVFAVFEVRPKLDRKVIHYAADKASSVRRLHRTSTTLVDRGVPRPPREPFEILAGVLTTRSSWSPPYGASFLKVLSESDSVGRLQLGCAPKHGAFEAVYGNGPPTVEISDEEGAVLFFLLRLFNSLQAIGSPMAIDLREYSRVLEDHEVTGLGAVS